MRNILILSTPYSGSRYWTRCTEMLLPDKSQRKVIRAHTLSVDPNDYIVLANCRDPRETFSSWWVRNLIEHRRQVNIAAGLFTKRFGHYYRGIEEWWKGPFDARVRYEEWTKEPELHATRWCVVFEGSCGWVPAVVSYLNTEEQRRDWARPPKGDYEVTAEALAWFEDAYGDAIRTLGY